MSKSKRNTVDPDEIIATYGADVARWFMLSDSPPERDVNGPSAACRAPGASCSGCGGWSAKRPRSPNRRRPSGRPHSRRRRWRLRKADPSAPWQRSPMTSKSCISTSAWRAIYEFANALGEAIGDIGSDGQTERSEPLRRRTCAGRCAKRLTFLCNCFADDAASGRGMLGRARPRDAGRGSGLAAGRTRSAGRGHA